MIRNGQILFESLIFIVLFSIFLSLNNFSYDLFMEFLMVAFSLCDGMYLLKHLPSFKQQPGESVFACLKWYMYIVFQVFSKFRIVIRAFLFLKLSKTKWP